MTELIEYELEITKEQKYPTIIHQTFFAVSQQIEKIEINERLYEWVQWRFEWDYPNFLKMLVSSKGHISQNIFELFHYDDGEKRYILSPLDISVGTIIVSGDKVPLKIGNALLLSNIPTGLFVHNVELIPGKGGQMVRTAGAYAQVMAHDNGYTTLKLPSGEVRMVSDQCMATIGQVGNRAFEQIVSGKAGRSRWLGRRPKVRGVVMNPVDHPHGGGEGKTSGGRHPVSPWGKPTKGYKTRKKNKYSCY